MRAVVQRVTKADVTVAKEKVAQISEGLLVLLGVEKDDTVKDAQYLKEKILNLRIFEDESDKMNLSVLDVKGNLLIVSQFTLLADCRKGRRPSFDSAALPNVASELYEYFVQLCEKELEVQTGSFQQEMFVGLVNHGPVTILLDSKKTF